MSLSILLIDDHPLFRDGLAALLQQAQDDLQLLHAGNCEQARDHMPQAAALDLVIIDIDLPDGDGLSLLEQFRQSVPMTPVAMISAHDRKDLVQKALNLGAMGYLCKTSPGQVLVKAIELILAGGIYTPPNLHDGGADTAGLSSRQQGVLQCLCKGMSNQVIADTLHLSPGTVRNYVSEIYRILGVNRRHDAIEEAKQRGWISDWH